MLGYASFGHCSGCGRMHMGLRCPPAVPSVPPTDVRSERVDGVLFAWTQGVVVAPGDWIEVAWELPCGWCGSASGYETETDGWRRCVSCGGN